LRHPPKSGLKGQNILVEVSDLKVGTVVDIASKEIVETPNMQGQLKITNKSKDILDIQAVTFGNLDETGMPIPFQSGEKASKVCLFLKVTKPEEKIE
jgi:hypothetical protein